MLQIQIQNWGMDFERCRHLQGFNKLFYGGALWEIYLGSFIHFNHFFLLLYICCRSPNLVQVQILNCFTVPFQVVFLSKTRNI